MNKRFAFPLVLALMLAFVANVSAQGLQIHAPDYVELRGEAKEVNVAFDYFMSERNTFVTLETETGDEVKVTTDKALWADATGSGSGWVKIPKDLPTATYRWHVYQYGSAGKVEKEAFMSVKVVNFALAEKAVETTTVAVSSGVPTAEPELPDTGGPTWLIALIGLVVVATPFVLIWLGRRRAHRRSVRHAE